MAKGISDDVIAMVFDADSGTCFVATSISMIGTFETAVRRGGGRPVVFYREGHGPEGNHISGNVSGPVVQAGDIHGEVRFG